MTLYESQPCKHGETKSHQIGPDPDCKSCKGEGYTIGVSGSDAYASDCHCVENCRGSQLVPVEPITVICKHNTPDALTTSLFLSPVDGKAIPEGTYALVKLGDRKDDGIGDDDE